MLLGYNSNLCEYGCSAVMGELCENEHL